MRQWHPPSLYPMKPHHLARDEAPGRISQNFLDQIAQFGVNSC